MVMDPWAETASGQARARIPTIIRPRQTPDGFRTETGRCMMATFPSACRHHDQGTHNPHFTAVHGPLCQCRAHCHRNQYISAFSTEAWRIDACVGHVMWLWHHGVRGSTTTTTTWT